MPFILNEEEALKTLLTGMTVSDSGNPNRPVAVFYGQPDKEIRQQAYPYITIDLINISEDVQRVQSGTVVIPYQPEGWDGVSSLRTPFPTPINLDYQISTFSRQPRHDRQILAQLFSIGRLPIRFGTMYVPQDNTMRRVDILGFSKRDTTESEKRLFMNVSTVRIGSELFRYPVNGSIDYQVTNVDFGLKSLPQNEVVPDNSGLYNTLLLQQSQSL
jgi:hypothetical protein